jgi:hypothetical protein
MNVLDYFKWIANTPNARLFVVVLFVLLATALLLIFLGYTDGIWKLTISKQEDRRGARVVGFCFLGMDVILFVLLYLTSRTKSLPELLGDYIAIIVSGVFAVLAFFGVWALQRRLKELVVAENHLVANVEDATRHLLRGFPQIFDRALQLIEEAEREIWIVNFALNFGGPHCCSEKKSRLFTEVAEVYNKLPVTAKYPYGRLVSRDFARDIGKFFATLNDKAGNVPIVNILTVNDDGAKSNFLAPLSERPRYKETYTPEKFNSVFGELVTRRNEVLERMKKGRDKVWDTDVHHEAMFCETGSMPIQLLIVGTKSGRYGCLVFMVGTEILQGLAGAGDSANGSGDSPVEFGFYTELEEIAIVYRGLAQALLKQAEGEYRKAGLLPPYKETPSASAA